MSEFDYRYLFHLAYCPVLFLLSLIFKKYPPKKFNSFMSFRTSAALKSELIWKEANIVYPKKLFLSSLIGCLFQIPLLFLPLKWSFTGAAIIMCVVFAYSYFSTESYLKKIIVEENQKDS